MQGNPAEVRVHAASTAEELRVLQYEGTVVSYDWYGPDTLAVGLLRERHDRRLALRFELAVPAPEERLDEIDLPAEHLTVVGTGAHRVVLAEGPLGEGLLYTWANQPGSWMPVAGLRGCLVINMLPSTDRTQCLVATAYHPRSTAPSGEALLSLSVSPSGPVLRELYLAPTLWATWLSKERVAVIKQDLEVIELTGRGSVTLVQPGTGLRCVEPTADAGFLYGLANGRLFVVDLADGSLAPLEL
jgi:hypothetical protein